MAQGQGGSGGRIEALQSLAKDRVSLNGVTATGADLSQIQLPNANLVGAHLSQDVLVYANFDEAAMGGADLSGSGLLNADLTGAYLTGADLSRAYLSRAINTTRAQLAQAQSLKGAIMPDGIRHP